MTLNRRAFIVGITALPFLKAGVPEHPSIQQFHFTLPADKLTAGLAQTAQVLGCKLFEWEGRCIFDQRDPATGDLLPGYVVTFTKACPKDEAKRIWDCLNAV